MTINLLACAPIGHGRARYGLSVLFSSSALRPPFYHATHLGRLRMSDIRHYCRNTHCRSKLKAPVENEHHAFCAAGCYDIFYRKRCLACEKPLRNARRSFCPQPGKCANLVRTWPQKYRWPGYCTVPPRSAHFTGLKIGPKSDHRCLQGWGWTPEVDLELELHGTGGLLARLEHNRGRYRLTYPSTIPIRSWADLEPSAAVRLWHSAV